MIEVEQFEQHFGAKNEWGSSMPSRRKTIKTLAGAGAVVGLLPTRWTKPALESIVLPAHAQTSDAVNLPPVGESFTVDAFADSAIIVDVGPRVSDPEGDPITLTIVDSGVLGGGLSIDSVSLSSAFEIQVSVNNGSGEIFVDYQLNDGMSDSPVYRITITNLDGPFAKK